MIKFNQKSIVKLSLISFLLAFYSNVYAQVTDFKMNDYKYRTVGVTGIGLNVGSTSALNLGVANNLAFTLTPNGVFNKQYSLDDKQFIFWNWSNVGISKPVVKDNPLLWNINTQVDWNKRIYKGQNFVEFGSKSLAGVNRNTNPMDSNKKVIYMTELNPSVGIGQGRLEYISNAQMALFILEDLKQAGKIKGTVSKEVAYKFTDLITQLYNSRVFDFRKRRNYEIAKIDSFLRQNKIINATDVNTYNIIADNWNYAIQPQAIEASTFNNMSVIGLSLNPFNSTISVSDRINLMGVFGQVARYAGIRKSLILNLPSTFNNNSMQFINIPNPLDTSAKPTNVTNSLLGVNLTGIWENHKALSLQRQQIISFWIGGGSTTNAIKYKYDTKSDSTNKSTNRNFNLGASYQLGYYPNSRTALRSVTSLMVNKNSAATMVNLTPVVAGTNIVLQSTINGTYFLNFRTRISGNVGAVVNANKNNTGLNFFFNLSYVNYLF